MNQVNHCSIGPVKKGVSFLSYTNMNKMNSLYHMKEYYYPKISNFLQFESYSSKCVKVRATVLKI